MAHVSDEGAHFTHEATFFQHSPKVPRTPFSIEDYTTYQWLKVTLAWFDTIVIFIFRTIVY